MTHHPIRVGTLAAVLAALSACKTTAPEPAAPATATPVTSEQSFRAQLAGRALTDARKFTVTYLPDGSITGDFHGAEAKGNWVWRDGRLCRTLIIGLSKYGQQCVAVAVVGAAAKFDGPGADASVLWAIEG